MKFRFFILLMTPTFLLTATLHNWNPDGFSLLLPTERKPARTAVLIVVHPDDAIHLEYFKNSYTGSRWNLTKKVWEQYMNVHPNIDCYFVQHTDLRMDNPEQTWIDGNTIYVGIGCDSHENGGIPISKTVAALEKLYPHYTHFFRTNTSAFVNLNALNEYVETHHQSMFTGPLWEDCWWIFGYGILFTADVAPHIVAEYQKLKEHKVIKVAPEDLVLTALATGICPYYGHIEFEGEEPVFTCCPTLPLGVRQLMCKQSFGINSTNRISQYGLLLSPPPSFEETLDYCSQSLNSAILYRIRHGFDLDKLAEVYEYLLKNTYPGLPLFDLVEYAKSLPIVREDKP